METRRLRSDPIARSRTSAASASRCRRAAAVDDDRDLAAQAQAARPQIARRSHAARPAASISVIGIIGERIGDDRHALGCRQYRALRHRGANSGAERGVKPRNCRLPRAVISIDAVAVRARCRAEGDERVERNVASAGISRTSSPSPVAIGADRPGQAPRRMRGAFTAAPPPRTSAEIGIDIVAARMPQADAPRGSSRSAIARAAAGFSRSRKSRTRGSAR